MILRLFINIFVCKSLPYRHQNPFKAPESQKTVTHSHNQRNSENPYKLYTKTYQQKAYRTLPQQAPRPHTSKRRDFKKGTRQPRLVRYLITGFFFQISFFFSPAAQASLYIEPLYGVASRKKCYKPNNVVVVVLFRSGFGPGHKLARFIGTTASDLPAVDVNFLQFFKYSLKRSSLKISLLSASNKVGKGIALKIKKEKVFFLNKEGKTLDTFWWEIL